MRARTRARIARCAVCFVLSCSWVQDPLPAGKQELRSGRSIPRRQTPAKEARSAFSRGLRHPSSIVLSHRPQSSSWRKPARSRPITSPLRFLPSVSWLAAEILALAPSCPVSHSAHGLVLTVTPPGRARGPSARASDPFASTRRSYWRSQNPFLRAASRVAAAAGKCWSRPCCSSRERRSCSVALSSRRPCDPCESQSPRLPLRAEKPSRVARSADALVCERAGPFSGACFPRSRG